MLYQLSYAREASSVATSEGTDPSSRARNGPVPRVRPVHLPCVARGARPGVASSQGHRCPTHNTEVVPSARRSRCRRDARGLGLRGGEEVLRGHARSCHGDGHGWCSDLLERKRAGPRLSIGARGHQQCHRCNWAVGDQFDSVIDDLRGKGVTFEHYDDLPETTREGDIHTIGGMRGVWFKDPDGNILSVVEQ